ncbi:salicylate hydroxylase, partial [Fusarium subglutinans]
LGLAIIGWVKFKNGLEITADLVVATDSIRSNTRAEIGVETHATPLSSCCYRCIVPYEKLEKLGLTEYVTRNAIKYWGGMGIEKIVMSPAGGGSMICCYCFYPASLNDTRDDGWNVSATPEQLVETFKTIEPNMKRLFAEAEDIKMWRLYDHKPYEYWVKGKVALSGDAAYPMMPDQSQGAVSAFEDAVALSLLFSESNLAKKSVEQLLKKYESLRKPRATMLQAASLRARLDLTERIGWSSVDTKPGKLTIEDVAGYKIVNEIASKWSDIAIISSDLVCEILLAESSHLWSQKNNAQESNTIFDGSGERLTVGILAPTMAQLGPRTAIFIQRSTQADPGGVCRFKPNLDDPLVMEDECSHDAHVATSVVGFAQSPSSLAPMGRRIKAQRLSGVGLVLETERIKPYVAVLGHLFGHSSPAFAA